MSRFSMGKRVQGLIFILAAVGAIGVSFSYLQAHAAESPMIEGDEDANVYPPNAPAVTGRAAAKKVWETLLADKNFSISWKPVHVEVSKSGEMGFTAGT